jgi:hypothetical protein
MASLNILQFILMSSIEIVTAAENAEAVYYTTETS